MNIGAVPINKRCFYRLPVHVLVQLLVHIQTPFKDIATALQSTIDTYCVAVEPRAAQVLCLEQPGCRHIKAHICDLVLLKTRTITGDSCYKHELAPTPLDYPKGIEHPNGIERVTLNHLPKDILVKLLLMIQEPMVLMCEKLQARVDVLHKKFGVQWCHFDDCLNTCVVINDRAITTNGEAFDSCEHCGLLACSDHPLMRYTFNDVRTFIFCQLCLRRVLDMQN